MAPEPGDPASSSRGPSMRAPPPHQGNETAENTNLEGNSANMNLLPKLGLEGRMQVASQCCRGQEM
eukprot:12089787-Prorocentrum_lima.AAC.1